jgi:copper chaperone CopZ
MKKGKLILIPAMLFAFAILFTGNVFAQEKKSKTETIEIKSSVVCGMCKEKIEKELAFEKGVKAIDVNLKAQTVTVTFNPKKTDKEKIKKAITEIGYDADDLIAEEKAYNKLPACCKKDVAPH